MKTENSMGRRDFLRALGAGAGGVITTSAALVENAAAYSESSDEKRKSRYRSDSPHVQAYYRVNRYPAK